MHMHIQMMVYFFFQMKFFVSVLALASCASASTVAVYPAGVDPAQCRDYPNCPIG